ncbi:site-specific integrase [Mycobacteroides abscessus]|uniref:site-specific integrase n=1 Tax=Mycobacteroides abscessus TaxID=36809 RepID=UPI00092BBDEE|nr:site-specific integrase [Mycobacteroides abscessus]DAZ90287.1 TPA_asm: tyrosine integrase [Mycobacterium phage prophiFSQJ01-1]SII40020.1 integrase [Mycobacteroides abscessus subsp. abscessus]SIK15343.1 integrase [Mycobacteroides abscessus subsp. abscessus]SIN24627.1 integrase [Mycobacteroides abscessus subsp. abscessus]SLI52211.1 integrase [Mycobacteroides abscessus subsp. abscessus]
MTATTERCPTPQLKGYADKAAATDELKRRFKNPPKTVKPYECDCGLWHLTPRSRSMRGEAKPYKRGDGLWAVAVTLPTADGQQRRKVVTAKDRGDVLDRRRELLKNVAKGAPLQSQKTTVKQWMDYWLEEIHRPNVRPETYRYYELAVRRYVNPTIGGRRLSQLTPADVRSMHKQLQKGGSTRNAQKGHQALQRGLKDAITEGLVDRNVASLVSKPGHVAEEILTFTAEEAKHIMRTAIQIEDPLADRWVAAFLTVSRPSELNGLEWNRLNLGDDDDEIGEADLSWQLQELHNQIHGCGPADEAGQYPCGRQRPGWCPSRIREFPPGFEWRECHRAQVWTRPKTAAGTRNTPIVEPLLSMLRLRYKQRKSNKRDLVWAHPDGRPIGPTEMRERWHALMVASGFELPEIAATPDDDKRKFPDDKLELPDNKLDNDSGDDDEQDLPNRFLYQARHTAGTLLMELGVPEDVRMAIMGQSSVVAHRGYIHVDQTHKRSALSKLAGLLTLELD